MSTTPTTIDPAEHLRLCLWIAAKYERERGLEPGAALGDTWVAFTKACAQYQPGCGLSLSSWATRKTRWLLMEMHRDATGWRVRGRRGIVFVPLAEAGHPVRHERDDGPDPALVDTVTNRYERARVSKCSRVTRAGVVAMLARGLTARQAARALGISEAGVHMHIRAMRGGKRQYTSG